MRSLHKFPSDLAVELHQKQHFTMELKATDIAGYREELVISLSSARELAAQAIQQAQRKYKDYDKSRLARLLHWGVGPHEVSR